jgi:hypothetical protein
MKPSKTLLAAAAVAGLAACSSPAVAPTAPPRPRLIPAATTGAPFTGVYETNSAGSFSLVRDFAASTGVRPSIVLSYTGWGVPFNTALADDEHAIGATPLVQLDPQGPSVKSIAEGRSDVYLRHFADQVRVFAHPVILSFGHEMNGSWYPWGEGHTSPAVFIAAWRHIVDVFREQGAANVTWMWTANAVNAARDPLHQWWPGSAYVNWVGIDGYYYFPTDTFSWVFGRTITEIRTFTTAPILIGETGVGPNPNAAQQVRSLFAGIKADHLLGFVWFDRSQHIPPYHLPWRIEGDPLALAAFRAAATEDPR